MPELGPIIELLKEIRLYPWKEQYIADFDPASYREVKRILETPLFKWTPFGAYNKEDQAWSLQAGFVSDPHKIVYAVTSNRGGKTVGASMMCAGECLGIDILTKGPSRRFQEPIHMWSVSDTGDTSIDIIERCIYEEVLGSDETGFLWNFVDEKTSYSTEKGFRNSILAFKNGSTWRFKNVAQNINTFKGTKLHIVWLDEPKPKSYYSECRTRLVDLGGYLFWTMTPIIEITRGIPWNYYAHYLKRQQLGILFHNWSLWDNPYIPRGEIDRLMIEWDEDEVQARAFGLFVPVGLQLAFPLRLIRACEKNAVRRKPHIGELLWGDDEKPYFEPTNYTPRKDEDLNRILGRV